MPKRISNSSIKNKYTRKLSIPERGWIIYGDLFPPFANQMIIEGCGNPDIKLWKDAITKASQANPGSRLVLRGCLHTCRWIDSGKTPPLREVDGREWSGYSPDGAPFLKDRLFVKNGPTCEVVIIHGKPLRIAFRTHHSVMDGRGTLLWVEDIFRVLRGESPIGSFSTLTDFELARSFQKEYRKPFPRDNIVPTGRAVGQSSGVSWGRRRINGNYSKLLAQEAVLLAREARRHADGNFLIAITVDLRPHKPNLRSSGNLTNVIYAEIKPDTSSEELDNNIKQQLTNNCDGMLDRSDRLIHYIPLWLLKKMARRLINEGHSSGQYGFSGIISNLGLLKLEDYTGGSFQPDTIFFVPPGGANPAFMVLAGTNNGVELTLSLPDVLASDGRLEASLDRIANGLVANDKKPTAAN